MKPAPENKKLAYGGVLIDGDGKVLLREPRNHFGGYVWTYAKGRPDAGESPQQAALREVREECGWDAEIVAELDNWFAGDSTATYFWLMRPLRDAGTFDWETNAVRWVSFEEARGLIAESTTSRGRQRDLAVLALAEKAWAKGGAGA